MFACIYFQKDASLSVISRDNKDLTVLEEFSARKPIQMKWRLPGRAAEKFDGVIVRTDDNKERLDKFANKVQKTALRNVVCGSEAPEELFNVEEGKKSLGGKRDRVQTYKMRESIEQDEEIPPPPPKKKKKKTKTNPEKPDEGKTETNPEKLEKINSEEKKTPKTKLKMMKNGSDNIATPAQQVTNQKKAEERTAYEIGKSMLGLLDQFEKEPSSVSGRAVPSAIEIDAVSRAEPSANKIAAQSRAEPPAIEIDAVSRAEPSANKIAAQSRAEPPAIEIDAVSRAEPSANKIATQSRAEPPAIEIATLGRAVRSAIEIASTVDHGNKDTPLTETWSQCRAAINTMAAENVTITVPRTVVKTLGMMCQPEFLDFMTQLHNHLQDQSCNHSCFQVMSQEKNYQADGSLLSQLYSTDPADDESHLKSWGPSQTSDIQVPSAQPTWTAPVQSQSTSHHVFVSPMVTELSSTPQRQESLSRQYVPITSPPPQRQQEQSVSHVIASVTPTSVAHSETTPLQILTSPEQQTPVRRSPRKKGARKIQYDPVPLLPNKPSLSANRAILRKAQAMATEKSSNGAYYLMYHLLPEIFTLDELANSRGTGLAANDKEQDKHALNTDKLNDLKVYVNAWCTKNLGKQFPDSMLNKAVTERIGYARKQLKKMGSPSLQNQDI